MKLSLTLRALGKTLSNEGHGLTGCGKTHVLYQGTTLVVPWSFYIFLKRQPPEPIRAS